MFKLPLAAISNVALAVFPNALGAGLRALISLQKVLVLKNLLDDLAKRL